MSITIHIGSLLLGFFIGYAVIAAVFLAISFDNRRSEGFSEGWKCGCEYGEKLKKEKQPCDTK